MALMNLKSKLSWYNKNAPGPYHPNKDRTDTKFDNDGMPSTKVGGYSTDGTQLLSPYIKSAADKFIIDDVSYSNRGEASRQAQLGMGTKFPIGPSGQVHTFDIIRTGFNGSVKYADNYGVLHKNKGLADTYTKDSPIDDMYNKFNLRDDATNYSYSKQPFILRGIQRKDNSDPQRWGAGNSIAGQISSVLDLPRGGVLTAIERATLDTARLAKFMISPRGIAYAVRQVGQQLMNPNTEGKDGKIRKIFGKNSPKLWTPVNTLLQPLAGLAGMHVRRSGLFPVDLPIITPHNYEDVILSRTDTNTYNHNRLVQLKTDLLVRGTESSPIGKIADMLGIGGKHEIGLLSGKTGPHSVGGLGKTTIHRYSDTSIKTQLDSAKGMRGGLGGLTFDQYFWRVNSYAKPYIGVLDNGNMFTVEQVDTNKASKTNSFGGRKLPGYDPYGLQVHKSLKSLASKKQPRVDGERTFFDGGGISEYKDKKDIRNDYTRMSYGIIPKRDPGSTKVYDFRELVKSKTDGGIARWSDPTIDSIDESIDKSLIAFNIGGIAFKAYLGTLTDSFAPGWNGEADQGRADSRYLYTSFERTIQTDFMVPVYKEAYRSEIWNKLQNLARKTYPVYGSNGFYGQSIDVTIGDLYKSKKMIITDLSYDWDNETPWEITKGIQAPMYTNVSISFTVLSPKPTSNDKVYMNI